MARAGRDSEVVGHVVVGTPAGAGPGIWEVGSGLVGVDAAWCGIGFSSLMPHALAFDCTPPDLPT